MVYENFIEMYSPIFLTFGKNMCLLKIDSSQRRKMSHRFMDIKFGDRNTKKGL